MDRQHETRIGRDAATGRFIPVKEALLRPATTMVERVKRRHPAKRKRPAETG